MKIIVILMMCLSVIVSPVFADSPKEIIFQELIEANDIVTAAGTSNLAYSNRTDSKIIDLLEQHNFDIEQYSVQNNIVDTQMILSRYYSTISQKSLYIVTFRGSNNRKDWSLNLKYGKVTYDSGLIERKGGEDFPTDVPMVHNGFNEYVNTALKLTDSNGKLISDLIINDKSSDVLVTGHSLGGAAAVLYSSRLLDMGLDPSRLKVITFGAPPVGNKAYVDLFAPKINLTRIVANQDLVPTVLKPVGGYVQFGKEIKLEADPRKYDYFDQHNTGLYLHQAIKYYFDIEDKAIAAGVIPAEPLKKVAPNKPIVAIYSSSTSRAKKTQDARYMEILLEDQLRSILPSYATIYTKEAGALPEATMGFEVLPQYIEAAKKENAKLLLLTAMDVVQEREQDKKSVILSYMIIDVNSQQTIALASISSSFNSRNAILETLLFDISQLPFKILM